MNSTLNFAQKTNFIAGSPQFPNIEFYLQSVSLPGISLNLVETKSGSLSHFVASDDHSYGSLSFSALIDEDFKVYDLFFNQILDSKSLTNRTFSQINFDFYIQVYNNKGNLLFTEYFRNCLIESLSDVSLSTTDDGVVNTIDIGLKFDWLEIKRDGISETDREKFNVFPPKKEKCKCNCETCLDRPHNFKKKVAKSKI